MKYSLIRSVLPYLVIGVAVVVALETFKVQPVQTGVVPDTAAISQAGDRVAAVDGIDDVFASCPADIWRKRQANTLWSNMTNKDWSETTCNNAFADCVNACVDRRRGDACRQVARVIEVHGMPEGDIDRRKLNALACSLGNPSGCTNRGAEIRNSAIVEDALSQADREVRNICLFRSFDISCSAGDAWGCSMLGQSFRLGEGVQTDRMQAAANYERACALHPGPEEERTEYAPCRFARNGLEALKQE